VRVFGGVLCEDRLEHRGHRRALLGLDMRQGIAHPVNTAALERAVEHPRRHRAQALVVVGDDQPDAAQPARGQRAQERLPEHLGLRRAGGNAKDLATAVGVDAHSDYRRQRDGSAEPCAMRA
jgi:hypothetical protein